ncbi:SatD family protein [Roseibium polysiphoniae]|uniref:Helix-turn-helix domain-containing protein n=1 Tax=Roseibium polysiphoniae TaxID=2571221 RepID=A0ABR9CF71_9HYPH|nr:SatD family protein [Roseibium polysiphoniae]MBD8878523.1 helix-turn-helix domain-containing protein [Roseibium polysiphoniae]
MSEAHFEHPLIVVMGDLVASEEAESRQELHRRFNAAVDAINAKYKNQLRSPLTITLGDEFQGLAADFSSAFEIAHDMRLTLLKQDVFCRFVVGQVDLQTPVNPDRAWNMMADGLAEARARLEDKADPNAYRFSFLEDQRCAPLLEAIGASLTDIEEGWTSTQRAYLIPRVLDGESVKDIAARHNVSARTVYNVLVLARFNLYDRQTEAIRAFLKVEGGSATERQSS